MTFESPAEHAEQAASVLAPESGLLADLDIAGLGRSLGLVFRGALGNPAEAATAWARYALRLAQIPSAALSSWLGGPAAPPVPLDPKDRRFADRTWSDNPPSTRCGCPTRRSLTSWTRRSLRPNWTGYRTRRLG